MAVKPETRLKIGDLVAYKKDDNYTIYKILLINYMDSTLVVRIVYPSELASNTSAEPHFKLKLNRADLEVLNQEMVKLLYG